MKLTKSQLRQIIREEMVKNTLNKSIKSVNEQNVYIDFLNKAKGFKKDRKIFKGPNAYDLAVKWAKKNFDNFNPDMIKFESVNEAKLKSIIRSVIKEEMISEATSSQIGYIDKNGNIVSTYVHWDGYPSGVGATAKKYYGGGKVKKLLAIDKGAGISLLNKKMDGGTSHSYTNPEKDQTIFYGRDRGQTGGSFMKGKLDKVSSYIEKAGTDNAFYVYLYNEKDGKWYFADTDGDKKLKLL